ncbi:uncharacterized protein LOC127838971 [Dreissena polymorpha]|nr:uncharacterized protein LOC127838971 [Dreissena polymorpha]
MGLQMWLLSVVLSLACPLGHGGMVQGSVTSEPPSTSAKPTNACVDSIRMEVEACINPLKTDLASKIPTDVNNFLCGPNQRQRLDCVIQHFRQCPDLIAQDFIKTLRHVGAKFYAEDLFHIKNAEEFCMCVPTHGCLSEIDFDQMATKLELKHEHPWKSIANPAYICGLGLKNIECVGHSPVCTQYLQHKHNDTAVKVAEYAHKFAKRQCKTYPKDNHKCTEKRVSWRSLAHCYDLVENIVDEEERKCGMRRCVEIDMSTCPPGDMEYFIDAINVLSENEISDKACSSANAAMATIFTICGSMLMAMLV